MPDARRPPAKIALRYKLYYLFSVLVLVAVLCVEFGMIYTTVLEGKPPAGSTMRMAYLAMVVGFLVLFGQLLLIFKKVLPMLGRDASALAEANERLDMLAECDELTNAYNRDKFEEIADHQLADVRRYALDLSCIMLDVDGFKEINQIHGYGTGDKLLANMARYLKKKLRTNDYLFRWRGGKFIVLTPHTDIDHAAMLAEKLRQMVGHKLWGGRIHMRISLGVVQAEDDDTVESLVHRMQAALAGAKNSGRDRVVMNRSPEYSL